VQAELAKLGIQLPNNPGLPTLIRSLSSAADAAGVDLVSMSPSQPTAVGAPAATAPGTAAAAAAPSSAGALSSISVAVVVNGGYFQIEQFVSNLEALSRPFLTSAINMVPQKPAHGTSTTTTAVTSATTTQGYDGHLQATISGQIFMVSPAPAPAATSPVTAPTAAPSAPQK
jgi:Tfp pilus assembly protein PilO